MKLGECRSVVEGTQLFFVVQSLSCVLTLCDPVDWSMPGSSVFHCLLEFAQIHVHWVGDASHPLLLASPSILPSIRISSHQVAKVGSSPSNEYSGLISFRIDWFALLAVQGTLKSLLQHFSSLKASALWCLAFFVVQLSRLYMTTGKTNGGSGLVTKSCPTFATPWTVACQAPLSMGFSRQKYWSGLPFPSPEDLPYPGVKPGSPSLQADSLLTELQGMPQKNQCHKVNDVLWLV